MIAIVKLEKHDTVNEKCNLGYEPRVHETTGELWVVVENATSLEKVEQKIRDAYPTTPYNDVYDGRWYISLITFTKEKLK